ncbi:type II secretion system major pseudopilin GspG [Methylobacterium nonmethylotrophicum]|uniref:Type II secretion system core protein G n=1 Tax=Methylobacterium nonmethylotrophicum TaxID=1141884 RepID=A0A4Z0NUS7_9HYPH|nr:type II secretion system major pseudopilin GspG [Methylobacterium nonmethylotrophicum]TGE01033.1 type II secretion system protein GspG [Methylobacterium nonmethylotrophicum]
MIAPFRSHASRFLRIVRARPRPRWTRRGFTLVEILVVLTIIGLIMGLIGPQVFNVLGDARGKTAKIQIQTLGSALDVFYMDTGRYPTPDEGLIALVQRPADVEAWNGPYVKGGRVPKDPWGRAYVYRVPGRNDEPYEISSLGPSGRATDEGPGAAAASQ